MRTTLCEMHLLNDQEYWTHTGLNTRQKIAGREQDSRDQERGRKSGRVMLQTSDGVGHKFDHWKKYLWWM
jgi:hypothetical protein